MLAHRVHTSERPRNDLMFRSVFMPAADEADWLGGARAVGATLVAISDPNRAVGATSVAISDPNRAVGATLVAIFNANRG